MKPKLYKTDHFIYRQWDRGVDDSTLNMLLKNLERIPRTKSLIIAGSGLLNRLGLKVKKTTNLIIVSKGKVLITLFYVDDLYAYMKSLKSIINTIII